VRTPPLLAQSPGQGSQRDTDLATLGELHASGGQPTAMGSLAAQSLTCIPTSTLLSQPERDTHPPRHGSLGQPRHTLTNRRVPAHMVRKSYWSVKEVGDPVIAQARHTG
jgi:hypothetical protein